MNPLSQALRLLVHGVVNTPEQPVGRFGRNPLFQPELVDRILIFFAGPQSLLLPDTPAIPRWQQLRAFALGMAATPESKLSTAFARHKLFDRHLAGLVAGFFGYSRPVLSSEHIARIRITHMEDVGEVLVVISDSKVQIYRVPGHTRVAVYALPAPHLFGMRPTHFFDWHNAVTLGTDAFHHYCDWTTRGIRCTETCDGICNARYLLPENAHAVLRSVKETEWRTEFGRTCQGRGWLSAWNAQNHEIWTRGRELRFKGATMQSTAERILARQRNLHENAGQALDGRDWIRRRLPSGDAYHWRADLPDAKETDAAWLACLAGQPCTPTAHHASWFRAEEHDTGDLVSSFDEVGCDRWLRWPQGVFSNICAPVDACFGEEGSVWVFCNSQKHDIRFGMIANLDGATGQLRQAMRVIVHDAGEVDGRMICAGHGFVVWKHVHYNPVASDQEFPSECLLARSILTEAEQALFSDQPLGIFFLSHCMHPSLPRVYALAVGAERLFATFHIAVWDLISQTTVSYRNAPTDATYGNYSDIAVDSAGRVYLTGAYQTCVTVIDPQ